MQNFIVLGIIPGTSIQINLNFWIGAFVLFLIALSSSRLYSLLATIKQYFIIRRIAYAIDHLDIVTTSLHYQ